MSEGNVQRSFENELILLSYDDVKIDDFEKLYAITSAKLNAESMFDDDAYNPEDFDEICNFAQFKLEHPEFFEGSSKFPNHNDMKFYNIPIHIKMNGQKIKCSSLIDINGNGLYIILPDGKVVPSAEFRKLTDIQTFVESGALTDEDVQKLLKSGESINEISKLIENDELDILLIREKAIAMVKAKGLDPDAILKEAREKDLAQEEKDEEELVEEQEEQEEKDEKELDEEAIEDAERAGIEFEVLQAIAVQKGCKLHQIRLRELYREDIIKERIGKDLKQYKGRLAIARITYGFKEEMIIVDKTNGSIIHDNRKHDHEIEDLVPRWPHGTKMPIKKDEGRSYISYLDENGVVKQTKFLNNGKKIDMSKDERERFIVEVEAINKELSEAISAYEKNNTMENWQKVREAMAKRVAIDRKYDALRNQKDVTVLTLISAITQTIGEVGAPSKLREKTREDELEKAKDMEEEDPRLSGRRDPRWE